MESTVKFVEKQAKDKMQEDPGLNRNKVHFPRFNIYEKIHEISTTTPQDIKGQLFRCQSVQLRTLERS